MKNLCLLMFIVLAFACQPNKKVKKNQLDKKETTKKETINVVDKNNDKVQQVKDEKLNPKEQSKPELTVQEAKNILAYFLAFQESINISNLISQNPDLQEVIVQAIDDSLKGKKNPYSPEDISKIEKESQYDFIYNFVNKFLNDAKTVENQKEIKDIIQKALKNEASSVKEEDLKKSEKILAYIFIYDRFKKTPFEKDDALQGFLDGINQKKLKYSQSEVQELQKNLEKLNGEGKDIFSLDKGEKKILMYFSSYRRAGQLANQLLANNQTYIKKFFIEGAEDALKNKKNKHSKKQIEDAEFIYGKNVLYSQLKAFLSSGQRELALEAVNNVMSDKKPKYSSAYVAEGEKKLAYHSFFSKVKQINLKTKGEKENYLQGIKDGLKRVAPKYSQDNVIEARSVMESVSKKEQELYKKENLDWLKNNQKKQGVKTTNSGLQYKVVKLGKGKKPTNDSTVEVHYEGRLIDGKIFDSSYKREQTISFSLQGVIVGWTEGLQLMPEGSTFEFYIPANLAYGEQSKPEIPAHSTLIFKVELIKIK